MHSKNNRDAMLKMKRRRRAYLGRVLHQPITIWDEMTVAEILDYCHEASRIVAFENGRDPDKDDPTDVEL